MLYSSYNVHFHETQLSILYQQICKDLPKIEDLSIGEESLFDTDTLHFKNIILSLANIAQSLFVSLTLTIEKILKKYELILNKYQQILLPNIQNIDTTKFETSTAKIVPHHILQTRLQSLKKVYSLLNNVDTVISYPASNSNSWSTPHIEQAFTSLLDIGFDANKLNLIKKVSTSYDAKRVRQSLSEAGYSEQDISGLIGEVREFTPYVTQSYTRNLNKKLSSLSDSLIKQKEALDNDSVKSESQKILENKTISNKIMRLWWISHFIKAAYTIASDILDDIVTICKIALRSINQGE